MNDLELDLVQRITVALNGDSSDTEADLLNEIRDLIQGGRLRGAADLATPEEITRARSEYQVDEIGIDDDALVSRSDEGIWVQAWVWLQNNGVYCPECGNAVWDVPLGNKLAKCWNSEGHASGEPLVFDTMED